MKSKSAEKLNLYKRRNKDGKIEYLISKVKQEGTLLGSYKTYSEARSAMHSDMKNLRRF